VAGIPAFCFDAGMSVAESAPLAVQARVMVLAEDLDAAHSLLAEDAGEESGRSD